MSHTITLFRIASKSYEQNYYPTLEAAESRLRVSSENRIKPSSTRGFADWMASDCITEFRFILTADQEEYLANPTAEGLCKFEQFCDKAWTSGEIVQDFCYKIS